MKYADKTGLSTIPVHLQDNETGKNRDFYPSINFYKSKFTISYLYLSRFLCKFNENE